MHLGLGSEASVTLQIIRDFGKKKRMNHYTLEQTIEKVVNRQESVASCSNSPSYIWWHLGLDGGEIVPIVDYGKLPDMRGRYPENWAKSIGENDGVWKLVLGDEELFWNDSLKIMIENGLNFGPKYLTRVKARWGEPSYYDNDCDLYTEIEVIYAEPARFIDIPQYFEILTPKTTKITVL